MRNNIWLNKMYLYPNRTPACLTPLSILVLWKHSGSFTNSKPQLLRKICKITLNRSGPFSQNGCHSVWQLQIATTSVILSFHLSTKIISRGCSFQNCTHIKILKLWLKTDFMGDGVCKELWKKETKTLTWFSNPNCCLSWHVVWMVSAE